jgi:hypothetical protein
MDDAGNGAVRVFQGGPFFKAANGQHLRVQVDEFFVRDRHRIALLLFMADSPFPRARTPQETIGPSHPVSDDYHSSGFIASEN